MRGQKYQALIVVILLLTALPYSPLLSRAANIEENPVAEIDKDGDGIPDQPFRDSDGDGLSDDYEISLGFDPNDFDMAEKNQLEIINIMNDDGSMNNNVPDEFVGLDRFDARKKVIDSLKNLNLIDKMDSLHYLYLEMNQNSSTQLYYCQY